MLHNYFKIIWRNLWKNKAFSVINIAGLALGMAVTMMIGLWVWDELSFNTHYENYPRIAEVWQRATQGKESGAFNSVPIPLADELRSSYPGDFKYVARAGTGDFTIAAGENKFTQQGCFIEPDGPELFSFKMLQGSRNALSDPGSIMLSQTLAAKLFGSGDVIGKTVRITNIISLTVAGVYEDMPLKSHWQGVAFFGAWDKYVNTWGWLKDAKDNWNNNVSRLYVQIADHAEMDRVSARIRGLLERKKTLTDYTTELFLHPMRKWHLYNNFVNGENKGGLITYVWLFSIIGVFVLLLGCINFMNLSTARSEKRAREVGIRKAIGSLRSQLISQFYSESLLMAMLAFVLAVLIVLLFLPSFNTIAGKQVSFPWSSVVWWVAAIGFTLFTGFLAGSYPAIYLSSFQPVKVLKGTFRTGRMAALPRRVLVVLQFTVSVLLITGTVIVYRQIQFGKHRSAGYQREGLVAIHETTPEIYKNYDVIRNTLLSQGVIAEMAESQAPVFDIWAATSEFEWAGKDPSFHPSMATVPVRHEYGKAVGWQLAQGRDFSASLASDSMGMILNEAAVKYLGLKAPVGMQIRWLGKDYHVIGVAKDMIMTSPFQSIPPTVFSILREGGNYINIRLNPQLAVSEALRKMEAVFKQYNPTAPFEYTFVDEVYAAKFKAEERIATLSTVFALLAIIISCLGLFGLASYMAEQRTKEIGIRKVLGATVMGMWGLLSKDFMRLVGIAIVIAAPGAYFLMAGWLKQYEYRADITWWIFLATGGAALLISLLTVSYQAVKAALMNPVKSLRSE